MKPGNLQTQGAKSGGNTKDEDSIGKRIESSMRVFFIYFGYLNRFWCMFSGRRIEIPFTMLI